MLALAVNDIDPSGNLALVVRELFATNPNFNFGLTVVDPSVAVGWIYNQTTGWLLLTQRRPQPRLSFLPTFRSLRQGYWLPAGP
jgi:hypothetical protein